MTIKIALAGNPNCGKTTMYNDLTGSSQYVGNWPGVTVEKKEGRLKGKKDIIITDLPGVYSLSPYTLEEVVTRNYLLSGEAQGLINIVDGTNLERNLYLTTQLLELGIPVVIALNMMDLVKKNGDVIDVEKLSKSLGCDIIETSALKGMGSLKAVDKATEAAKEKRYNRQLSFSKEVEVYLKEIEAIVSSKILEDQRRFMAIKLFERDEKILESIALTEDEKDRISAIIERAEEAMDDDSESIITNERYILIGSVIKRCLKKQQTGLTTSDKIDRVVTNRFLALPIFALIIFGIYYISVSTVGDVLTNWANDTVIGGIVQPSVQNLLDSIGVSPWLNSLVVDGIIGGVGAVLGFVPQMLLLFFFLSILEDCGYMARVAFIMDRIFRKFGLSGKSFIPMIISTGCGVPGVMATKTIESDKDRRMTIMTTTFMPCGAKLPVIALIGGAIFPDIVWMAPGIYFLAIGIIVASGIILKKTKPFQGEPAPFVMELPQYHIPGAKGVFLHMWERSKSFIIKAGTVIFVACGLIWFLSSFGFHSGSFGMVEVGESLLAKVGGFVAPIFKPLGFGNWQASVAVITGFVAKEEVVGTLAVLKGLEEVSEASPALLEQIASMFTYGAAGLSFLAFNLFSIPCFAAVGAIRREMNDWKWTAFALAYQMVVAYTVSLIINQLGGFLSGALSFGAGTIAALLALLVVLYLLFRPERKRNESVNAEVSLT
ncbi:ferrous iron transport protein B [Alloiococcus sp. CFN-8]|uniref:ferrous iron transport protein B n=1 Tax=Alloiococcus sp. CFN-8 TaxID=3416081 RepID=UPI003CF47FFA